MPKQVNLFNKRRVLGKEYTVKFDIQVEMQEASGNKVGEGTNFVRLFDDPKSEITRTINGNTGRWGEDENATTYAHETGHLLGIDDLYYLTSPTTAENYKGVDKNELMGRTGSTEGRSKVTQKDIDAFGKYVLSNQKDGKAIIKAADSPIRSSVGLEKQDKDKNK